MSSKGRCPRNIVVLPHKYFIMVLLYNADEMRASRAGLYGSYSNLRLKYNLFFTKWHQPSMNLDAINSTSHLRNHERI